MAKKTETNNGKKPKKHGRDKVLTACAQSAKQECLPPEIHNAGLRAPTELGSVKEIREEMARIYKMVFEGKVMLQDATKLAYYLDRMIQAMKTEVELAAIQGAYAKAWSGVTFITDDEEVIDEI